MTDLPYILNVLRQHKSRLSERNSIQEIIVFGSLVRGEANEKSDVDVPALLSNPICLDFVQHGDELEVSLKLKVFSSLWEVFETPTSSAYRKKVSMPKQNRCIIALILCLLQPEGKLCGNVNE